MIDTHSHIDGPEFSEDIDEVIARAKENGIDKILVPGICLKDTPHLVELCHQHPGFLYPMIGLHPENIMDEDYNHALDQLESMIDDSTIAIGEIGIDLYWDASHLTEQIEVFERQISWAIKYNLPLMIHTRNAHKELLEIMERHRGDNLTGVFHCFTGTADEARDLLSYPGFMLGIGGVLTFKKSKLPEVVREAIPLSRIVLETDSPYMAPVPMRGKRNESSFVKYVAEKLGDIFGVDTDEIVDQCTANTYKTFPKINFF